MKPKVASGLLLLLALFQAEDLMAQVAGRFRLSSSSEAETAQILAPGGPEEVALLGVLSRHVFRSEVTKADLDDPYKAVQMMTEALADHFMATMNPAARRSTMQTYAHASTVAIGLVEPVRIVHVVTPWSGTWWIQLEDSSGKQLWLFSPWGELRKVEW